MIWMCIFRVKGSNQFCNLYLVYNSGLFAYGPDANGVISFDHMDHKTYMNYYNRLESALHGKCFLALYVHLLDMLYVQFLTRGLILTFLL